MKNKDKNKSNVITFPSSVSKIERQVEAILFSASEPLDIETIEKRVQSSSDIKKILDGGKRIAFGARALIEGGVQRSTKNWRYT